LEFKGSVVRLDTMSGAIVEEIDCRIYGKGIKTPINTAPHGIGLDADGETIWFTGKRTSTVGKINPDRTVEHFELPALGAVPIYLHAGPDGNVWGTELLTSKILRVTPSGTVEEFDIPTSNSRPIVIKPDPIKGGEYMWFTEEAGNKVGRIDMNGNIDEFPVPATQQNQILAGLAFDSQNNLWVQSYIDQKNPHPEGNDYIIKFDKSILRAPAGDLTNVPITYYKVPTRKTVMHRIKKGNDGNIYFTELKQDRLGKVLVAKPKQ
jgi:virginiamycin B lyase